MVLWHGKLQFEWRDLDRVAPGFGSCNGYLRAHLNGSDCYAGCKPDTRAR